jgi:hypothetical protein
MGVSPAISPVGRSLAQRRVTLAKLLASLKLGRYPNFLAATAQLYLLCLARRSLGEGGSLIPFAPLNTFSFARTNETLSVAVDVRNPDCSRILGLGSA